MTNQQGILAMSMLMAFETAWSRYKFFFMGNPCLVVFLFFMKRNCFGQSSVNNSPSSAGSCCVRCFFVNNAFALKSSWRTFIPLVTWILCLYYKCHLFYTELILLQQCVLTFYSLIVYGHLVYWNAAVHTADEDKQSAGLESFVNEKSIFLVDFRAKN